MTANEKVAESLRTYNHSQLCDELDRLNRQLEDMLDTILNTSVQAHLLEADLATLFDPNVAESLRQVKQDCERCSKEVYGDQ